MKKARAKRPNKPAKRQAGWDVSIFWRASARLGGVAVIASAIVAGIYGGGHITNPNSVLYNIEGKIAAQFGYAAQDIRIAGLQRQKPVAVLNAIKVRPNDSLIGFNARSAKAILEKVDWIKKAEVRRIYPNQLEIDVVERVPVAIWQRDGEFYVIDKTGAAFTSIDASDVKDLFVVTGEGAHKKVFELVNHIEAHRGLKSKIAAAGRVGERRWNLYLSNGMKVLLPQDDEVKGLARYVEIEKRLKISSKAVAVVDLRFSDRIIFTPIKGVKKQVKVSQN